MLFFRLLSSDDFKLIEPYLNVGIFFKSGFFSLDTVLLLGIFFRTSFMDSVMSTETLRSCLHCFSAIFSEWCRIRPQMTCFQSVCIF